MRRFPIILAIATLSMGRPAMSEEIDKFSVAGWHVGAYTDSHTGQFSACSIDMPYKSGITLLFSVDRTFAWSMGMYNEAWQLKEGGAYQLSYAVDGGRVLNGTAQALNSHMVTVDLPDSRGLFQQFRQGQQLRIDAAGGSFFFNLDGTNAALNAALTCTDKWVDADRGSQTTDPFAPPKPSQNVASSAGTGRAANPAEAISFMSNLLSISGVTGFTIVDQERGKNLLPGYDVVWMTERAIGGLLIAADQQTRDLDKVFSDVAASDAGGCKGKFASLRQPVDDKSRSYVLGRVVTACDNETAGYEAYYTLFARSAGGVYLMCVISSKDPETDSEAQEDNTRILEAVYRGKFGDDAGQ